MLVLPADHLIQDLARFQQAVASASALARQGLLVTFGIAPITPETGFGYIEAGDALGDDGKRVLRFVEKPSLDDARAYLQSGNFYWNSGMFCFQAGAILDEMARHAPDVAKAAQACWEAMPQQGAMLEIPAEPFSQVPNISIDYAVMERSSQVAMVPADFNWNDIGSWAAVREFSQPDADNNRATSEAIFVDSRNTYVHNGDRVVATVGVDNLMIIDTPDALLVAHSDKAQDVKKVVAQLKLQDHETYKLHRTVSRPWGTYTVLEEAPRFKIKRISVKPGAALSLQKHFHRAEHWIVVKGTGEVTCGNNTFLMTENHSTYIPIGEIHRLRNPGITELEIIEVQSGSHLVEDDIVRIADEFGRK
jgi:mannose-1-phosphate guanylyltransferase